MSPQPPVRLAIIGGGAAGLAALKCVVETEEYSNGCWAPTLYEARDGIGGIWYAEPVPFHAW